MLHEHHFRAMNTDIGAWVWSETPEAIFALHEVESMFHDVEAQLSRFRPQSELSRLNAAAGKNPVPVAPLLYTVLALALRAAEETGGVFDPTVLHALRQAGYDRSFETIPAQEDVAESNNKPHPIDWRQIRLDPVERTVWMPKGLGIDLGGIAKGWTVDQAAELLADVGPTLVDAGGDIRVIGCPQGEPWPVAVQSPFDLDKDEMVLALQDGAVATSSIGGRTWVRNGQRQHHLIDPGLGRPSESDLHTVTVLAATAVEAEVAAKVALILGADAGKDFLRRRGLNGLFYDKGGAWEAIGVLPMIQTANP